MEYLLINREGSKMGIFNKKDSFRSEILIDDTDLSILRSLYKKERFMSDLDKFISISASNRVMHITKLISMELIEVKRTGLRNTFKEVHITEKGRKIVEGLVNCFTPNFWHHHHPSTAAVS